MSYMGKVRPTIALTSSDIEDNAVTTSKLIDDAVTTAKIDDGTIATADIADDAVTADKEMLPVLRLLLSLLMQWISLCLVQQVRLIQQPF
jgi:hypothetical protein